jgi:hypothetical protein
MNNNNRGYYSSYLPTFEDETGIVSKCWHIKFRLRGITQKKAYNSKTRMLTSLSRANALRNMNKV